MIKVFLNFWFLWYFTFVWIKDFFGDQYFWVKKLKIKSFLQFILSLKEGEFVNIKHFWLILSRIWSNNYWSVANEMNIEIIWNLHAFLMH